MDRGELLGAAGELLAVEGNDIRFKKSLVQIEAKAKWQGMTPNERRPYEAKSEADKEAWDAYYGVSKPKVEPAPQASGSGGAAESSKAAEKPKPKPKEKKEVKSGPSASGDAGANALINPPKKPSHKKKEPSDDAPANIKKPKTEKAAAAAPKKKDNSGSGEKRKRIEQEPDTDEEDGGAAGASNPNASKGGVTVEEVACPELGVGWKCVSKKRGQGSGAKQVDKTYVSPDGKSFNSRIKVCAAPVPAIPPALYFPPSSDENTPFSPHFCSLPAGSQVSWVRGGPTHRKGRQPAVNRKGEAKGEAGGGALKAQCGRRAVEYAV